MRRSTTGRKGREGRPAREDHPREGWREDKTFRKEGRYPEEVRGENWSSRTWGRDDRLTREAVSKDRESQGWREDRKPRAGGREERQSWQEREGIYHTSMQDYP